jgi:CheY-like chemotaxis protein
LRQRNDTSPGQGPCSTIVQPTEDSPIKLRVVVADDDVTVQKAIEWLLRRTCDVVRCVATGAELVEAVTALEPDVIVCDAMMPAFFGSEALQRLRTAGPFAFVLVSAEPRDLQQWIEQGASCVVHSMDLDSDLVTAVQAAASGDIFISRGAIDAGPTGSVGH